MLPPQASSPDKIQHMGTWQPSFNSQHVFKADIYRLFELLYTRVQLVVVDPTQDSTFNAKWYAVDQIDQYGNTGLSAEWTHTAVQTLNNWMISAFKPEETMVKQQCPRTREACVQTLDYLIATRWRIDVSDQLWIQTTKFCTNLIWLSITKDVINPLKAVNGLYWQESRSFTENLIHGQC